MTIEYRDNTASLSGFISVEDAESLMEWLRSHPDGRLDLSACSHLHTACLQVLMAASVNPATGPQEPSLAVWLRNTLSP
ncbi:MAG: hypothetical protein RLZZ226_465 [Pseudomonadota bacterium]|jgi:hypothetical protein